MDYNTRQRAVDAFDFADQSSDEKRIQTEEEILSFYNISAETKAKIDAVFKQIEIVLKRVGNLPESIVSAFKLKLFNQLYFERLDLNEDLLKREAERISKLEETQAEHNPFVPTVGVEVEVEWEQMNPVERTGSLRGEFDYILKACKIRKGFDPNIALSESDRLEIKAGLYEIKSSPSHTSEAQSIFLQELVKLGVVPGIKKEKSKYAKYETVSLHVNFIIPKQLANYGKEERFSNEHLVKKYQDLLKLVSFFVSIAMVSDERVNSRLFRQGSDGVDIKEIIFPGGSRVDDARVQFSLTEFSDKRAYRVVSTLQALITAFYSHVLFLEKKDLTSREEKLANIFSEFLEKMKDFYSKNNIPTGKLTLSDEFRNSGITNAEMIILRRGGKEDAFRACALYVAKIKRVLKEKEPLSEQVFFYHKEDFNRLITQYKRKIDSVYFGKADPRLAKSLMFSLDQYAHERGISFKLDGKWDTVDRFKNGLIPLGSIPNNMADKVRVFKDAEGSEYLDLSYISDSLRINEDWLRVNRPGWKYNDYTRIIKLPVLTESEIAEQQKQLKFLPVEAKGEIDELISNIQHKYSEHVVVDEKEKSIIDEKVGNLIKELDDYVKNLI